LKLVKIVKPLPCSLANGPQMNTKGKDRGMPDAAVHWLHICCTMRANGSFAIRGNAEFFGCGMWKSDKG